MKKIKIAFVCHGNICRSPMAEFVMKKQVMEEKLEAFFEIHSMATSFEEIGSDTHGGTKKILIKYDVPFIRRQSKRFERQDYSQFDYILCMDKYNMRNLLAIIGEDKDNKCRLLLSESSEEVADPYYYGDFEKTYEDILRGCKMLLSSIKKEHF